MSMDVDTISYASRRFLDNEEHASLAAIQAEIKPGDQEEGYLDFGAELRISDGQNAVAFDFGVYGQTVDEKDIRVLRSDLENARDKAMLLLGEVGRFVAYLNENLVAVEATLDGLAA